MSPSEERTELDAALLAILGELEDHETRLVQEQGELLRRLSIVDRDLERVQRTKAAALGTPRLSRAKRDQLARKERAIEYVRSTLEPVTARDLANEIGIDVQGAGGLLALLTREGIVEQRGGRGDRHWLARRNGS